LPPLQKNEHFLWNDDEFLAKWAIFANLDYQVTIFSGFESRAFYGLFR